VQNATAYFVHSAIPRNSSIEFSSQLLGKIERATRYSAMSNFQSVPVDCPQRERHGWMGDAHISSEGNIYAFDMNGAYEKYLTDVSDTQNATNKHCNSSVPVSAISPAYPGMYKKCSAGGPAWGAAYTILASHLSTYYEDDSAVRALYPGVKAYIESLISEANGSLLTISQFGDWCNVDLGMPQDLPSVKSCAIDSPQLAQCGCNTQPNARKRPIVSAFYYVQQIQMMADMAQTLGLHADFSRYSTLCQQMRAAFTAAFVKVQAPTPAPAPPGVCADVAEDYSKPQGHSNLALSCGGSPGGGNSTITKVLFAAFGTPTGSCDAGFAQGKCAADPADVRAAVEAACVGKQSCGLAVSNHPAPAGFGEPCSGTPKHLAVSVSCAPSSAAPAVAPTVVVGEGYQTDMAMALFLGLVPDGATRTAVELALLHDVRTRNGHLSTGMVGTKYLLPALSSIGQEGLEVAYGLATQDTMPSWGYWISMGATTLYESWIEAGTMQQRANNAGSLNHIMLGSQADWYWKVLAGITLTPGTRGWKNITLSPRVPAALEWVRASTNTVRGAVASSWSNPGSNGTAAAAVPTTGAGGAHASFLWNFSVPVGSTAVVELPSNLVRSSDSTVYDRRGGKDVAVWMKGAFVAGSVPGVVSGKAVAEMIVLSVETGNYQLRCTK
jgi:hypothetical protein